MHAICHNQNLCIISWNACAACDTKYQTTCILPCRGVPMTEKLHVLGRRSTPSTLPLKQTPCENAAWQNN